MSQEHQAKSGFSTIRCFGAATLSSCEHPTAKITHRNFRYLIFRDIFKNESCKLTILGICLDRPKDDVKIPLMIASVKETSRHVRCPFARSRRPEPMSADL